MTAQEQMKALQEEIEKLPKGNLTFKTIRGARRMYLQWNEEGKQKQKYIKAAEEADTIAAVELRKMLELEYQMLLEREERLKKYAALSERLASLELEYPSLRENRRFQALMEKEYPLLCGEEWFQTLQGMECTPLRADKHSKTLMMESGTLEEHTIFQTHVILGSALQNMCKPVKHYGQRECMKLLRKVLSAKTSGKVCLVYGLRRTGKTTMVLQAISVLPQSETAYIKIMGTDTMADLNRDLKKLQDMGYKYVFIDEVTLMKDFIDSASLLSDVYAMNGMKIVLSGTDSLGFAIAANEELYDRSVNIHTTFIPFREYARLLQIHDIDEYIRYGGTFRVGETDFDDPELNDAGISFRDDETTRRYIDTAIAKNIQHSLACYQDGGHFRHLTDLYEADELTSAVNRIIEDMNHKFLISVLTKDFKSHDLGSGRQIERKRAAMQGEESILDQIDTENVTQRLMEILSIKNKEDMSVTITKEHVSEIKEYLKMLDLILECPQETIRETAWGKTDCMTYANRDCLQETIGETTLDKMDCISYANRDYPRELIEIKSSIESVIFTQPGMRYCQAQALVYSLMKDELFRSYPVIKRKEICELILEEVRGRMLDEIVLLETIKTLPHNKKAFKLLFAIGEFDMVIADTDALTCEIYEIKHTDKVYEGQYKHLTDPEKCRQTEFEYGTITKKVILYRGKDQLVNGIQYKNVVEYLEKL